MLAGRRWILCITVALTVSRIRALRADPRLIKSKYVCENDVMHLVCKPPTVLEIHAADFGGSATLICGNSEDTYQSCQVMDKTDTVKTRCDGKQECYITALRAIFGDPCSGLDSQAHTSIYLNVIYACVQPINSGTSTEMATTQPSTLSSGISTVKEKSTTVTNRTTSPLNLTNSTNTTSPATKKPDKKTKLNIGTKAEVPGTQPVIPVFDPEKSVELEAISGTVNLRSSVVVFVVWFCITTIMRD